MKIKHFIILIMLTAFGLLLTACDKDSQTADIQKKVQQIKQQAKLANQKKTMPTYELTKPTKYQSSHKRTPFASYHETKKKGVKRLPLQNYSLDALRLIGIISKQEKDWAVVLAPNGNVYEVTLGAFIGQNDGKIVKILTRSIQISELIPNELDKTEHRVVTMRVK